MGGEKNWCEKRKRKARAFCIQRKLLAGITLLFARSMQNENARSFLHAWLRLSRQQQKSLKREVEALLRQGPPMKPCLLGWELYFDQLFPTISPCLIFLLHFSYFFRKLFNFHTVSKKNSYELHGMVILQNSGTKLKAYWQFVGSFTFLFLNLQSHLITQFNVNRS